MTQLTGIVSGITFQNDDTGFTVLRLAPEHARMPHTCLGVMPTVEKGESIAVRGEWENSPRFGPQFRVEAYEFVRPATVEGIRTFLSSGLIENIGPAMAQSITGVFGVSTLDVLERDPKQLLKVPGIGRKRLASITGAWERQRYIRDLMLFLQEFGVTANLAHKIYKAYGAKAREVISSNPYALIGDIRGVGFRKADAIAQKLGFKKESYRRIRAGMIHVLQKACEEGHVYMPRNEVADRVISLLGISVEKVTYSLDHVTSEKSVIEDDGRLYLPMYYHAECGLARLLTSRAFTCTPAPGVRSEVDKWFSAYCARTGWKGDRKQTEAFRTAVLGKALLLTGGPGTGKTTTLQVIVSYFRERGITVALCAPTGRAAQRMGSVAGLQASTIHRLLEFRPNRGQIGFARNEDNPVAADVVICDEVSMIDLFLMRHLLAAVRPGATLILVGDSNQLPSVGAGNVLADIVSSGVIPHVTLTTVFRQAAASRIVTAAHEIIRGTAPRFTNAGSDNCFLLQKGEPEECLVAITELVTDRLPGRYGLDPVRDLQVLSPMHKGIVGTQSINRVLQEKLNRAGESLVRGETTYRTGDKVMQVRNNYDNGVFNGDIGFVKRIEDGMGLAVEFEGREVRYRARDLVDLMHAYCISIHKSQGCEFRAVVVPLVTQHYVMLQRNLVYTALTRARELCVFVGTRRALELAVGNDQAFQRYSRLAERIAGSKP